MPWFNIVKKSVYSFMIAVRNFDCLILVQCITTFSLVSLSCWHLWFCITIHPGLFLALDVYRPTFSATSPYVVNTIRDNEHFLWICTGLWAVSFLFFYIHFVIGYPTNYFSSLHKCRICTLIWPSDPWGPKALESALFRTDMVLTWFLARTTYLR